MLRHAFKRARRTARGQTLVEMALAAPLFFMVLIGIIVLGIGVFYQQELTNVAREAARYAAIHSATAQCPTVSNLPPDPLPGGFDYRCDPPERRWPIMTAFARDRAFGLPPEGIQFSACWSGYWVTDAYGYFTDYDAPPANLTPPYAPNPFRYCTIPSDSGSGFTDIDPRTDPGQIQCTAPMPLTSATNDMASSMAAFNSLIANEVTVFACFNWAPPGAGFLLIPETVTLRAVITETMQYQQ